jgi:phage shock protein C
MSNFRNNRFSDMLPEGLVRDTVNGKVAGVCAGLGGYFSIKTKWVRLFLILSSVFGFFVPVLIVYIVLAVLMPPAPSGFAYGTPTVDEKGRRVPDTSYMREHFTVLDRRLANMEAWVTSEDYRLRQQFKNL